MLPQIDALRLKNPAAKILCFYINPTSYLQIIRIPNRAKSCLERVVFPGQQLLFEALPEAFIEIYTASLDAATLTEKIKCASIEVDEGLNILLPTISSNTAEKSSHFIACGLHS